MQKRWSVTVTTKLEIHICPTDFLFLFLYFSSKNFVLSPNKSSAIEKVSNTSCNCLLPLPRHSSHHHLFDLYIHWKRCTALTCCIFQALRTTKYRFCFFFKVTLLFYQCFVDVQQRIAPQFRFSSQQSVHIQPRGTEIVYIRPQYAKHLKYSSALFPLSSLKHNKSHSSTFFNNLICYLFLCGIHHCVVVTELFRSIVTFGFCCCQHQSAISSPQFLTRPATNPYLRPSIKRSCNLLCCSRRFANLRAASVIIAQFRWSTCSYGNFPVVMRRPLLRFTSQLHHQCACAQHLCEGVKVEPSVKRNILVAQAKHASRWSETSWSLKRNKAF